MDAPDVWNALLAKVSACGVDSLPSDERTLYRVNCFLIDFETGGLSGFLYNVSPAADSVAGWWELRAVAEAVETVGDPRTTAALRDAALLLDSVPPSTQGTWGEFLRPCSAAIDHLESRLRESTASLWDRIESFTKQSAAREKCRATPAE